MSIVSRVRSIPRSAVALATYGTVAVSGLSLSLSAVSLTSFAAANHVPGWQSWMLPGAVDGFSLVSTVMTVALHKPGRRAWAWAMLGIATLFSIAGNGIHAWAMAHSLITVGLFVLFPVLAFFATHGTVMLYHDNREAKAAQPKPRVRKAPAKKSAPKAVAAVDDAKKAA